MIYKTFPSTGWQLSAIGMGCWGIGGQWGKVEASEAFGAMERAIDGGMNFFDTADAYGVELGSSETMLGRFLAGRRHQVYLITKLGYWGRRQGAQIAITHPCQLQVFCDASLYRLRTDVIDLYLCHVDDCPNPEVYLEGFEKLKQQGKIRAYGVSTDSFQVAQAFHKAGTCAAIELGYSLLNHGARREMLPFCRKEKIGTVIRGPLAQGLLTGKFTAESTFSDQVRASWNTGDGRAAFLEKVRRVDRLRAIAGDRPLTAFALRALIEDPDVSAIIPGAKSAAQVGDHLEALSIPWTQDDSSAIACLEL